MDTIKTMDNRRIREGSANALNNQYLQGLEGNRQEKEKSCSDGREITPFAADLDSGKALELRETTDFVGL